VPTIALLFHSLPSSAPTKASGADQACITANTGCSPLCAPRDSPKQTQNCLAQKWHPSSFAIPAKPCRDGHYWSRSCSLAPSPWRRRPDDCHCYAQRSPSLRWPLERHALLRHPGRVLRLERETKIVQELISGVVIRRSGKSTHELRGHGPGLHADPRCDRHS